MWRSAGGADLATPEGRRAWRALVGAVGAERAAWLARTFPPVVAADGAITIDRPAEVRDQMRRSRLAGLPPTIELWLARGGQPPARRPPSPCWPTRSTSTSPIPTARTRPGGRRSSRPSASGWPPRSTWAPTGPTTSTCSTPSASAAATRDRSSRPTLTPLAWACSRPAWPRRASMAGRRPRWPTPPTSSSPCSTATPGSRWARRPS